MRYKSDPGDLGGLVVPILAVASLVGLVVLGIGIVVVVLAGFLIAAVLKARPHSVPVWIALICLGLSVLLFLITNGQGVVLILCLMSFVAVLIACFVEKAQHPELFSQEQKPPMLESALQYPWWEDEHNP
jgi:hypothetical protein